VAILARSLNIPLVVADAAGLQAMPSRGQDPFRRGDGATSTSIARTQYRRSWIGIDLNKEYAALKIIDPANTPPPRRGGGQIDGANYQIWLGDLRSRR